MLDVDQRTRLRVRKTKPIMDTFHDRPVLRRQQATDGTAIAKAIDDSLNRWDALARFVEDRNLPPDNNHIENRIRPIALGRSNWLFAGSLRGHPGRLHAQYPQRPRNPGAPHPVVNPCGRPSRRP